MTSIKTLCAVLAAGVIILVNVRPVYAEAAPIDAGPVVNGPEGRLAFDNLGQCYGVNFKAPDYKQFLADLKGADTQASQRAGRYILALFEQSFADESNDRARWDATPFVNAGPENRANEFRKGIAREFGVSCSAEAALPAAAWLIENDPLAANTEAGVHVLARVHSEAANSALERLIHEVHPNQEVLVTAINEAGNRHLTQCKDDVIALEQSYRKAVREAAVHAAAQLGETKPAPYDPLKAFSPRVVALLKATLERIQTPVPPNAQWLDGIAQPAWRPGQPYPVHGWLLSRGAAGVSYLDVFGRIQTAGPKEVQFTNGSVEKTAKSYVELRSTIEAETAEALAIQKSPDFTNFKSPKSKEAETKYLELWQDGEYRLKEMTPYMEYLHMTNRDYLDVPEVTVAAWCWQRGDGADAAAILYPCYNEARDDRWLDWYSRDALGNTYDLDLLEKFTVDRNYPAAIAIADHLGKPCFNGYPYQSRSRELATQLAARSDDFTAMTLPGPAEWEKIRTELDRPAQIIWLASRLKLMHCINPNYDQVQFASAYPDDHAPEGAPEVINPYRELIWLDLTPDDLHILAPYATDGDYSLSYTFYKDWIPDRGLCRVSAAVGEIINHVAGSNIVHSTESGLCFEGSQESRVTADLEAWVAAHRGETPDKLIAETLRTSNDRDKLKEAAITALKIHHVEVLGILADRIESLWKDNPKAQYWEPEFIHLFFSSRAPLVDRAKRWVKSPYPEVRLWAALILVRDGDLSYDEGFDTLEPLLRGPDAVDRYREAAPTLLASPSPRARRLAAGLFPLINLHAHMGDDLQLEWTYERYLLAGRRECFDFLIKALDDYTVDSNSHNISGQPVYVDENLAFWLGGAAGHVQNPETPAKTHEYREWLKAWLTGQFALIQAGKPSAIHSATTDEFEQYLAEEPVHRNRETPEAAAHTQD